MAWDHHKSSQRSGTISQALDGEVLLTDGQLFRNCVIPKVGLEEKVPASHCSITSEELFSMEMEQISGFAADFLCITALLVILSQRTSGGRWISLPLTLLIATTASKRRRRNFILLVGWGAGSASLHHPALAEVAMPKDVFFP